MKAIGRLFGVLDDRLGAQQTTCDRPALPAQKALVVAPGGFGDSLYRTAGALQRPGVYTGVLALCGYHDRRRPGPAPRLQRRRALGLSTGGK